MTSTSPDRVEDIIPGRTRYYERTGGQATYRIRKSSRGNEERGVLLNAPYTDNSNKFPWRLHHHAGGSGHVRKRASAAGVFAGRYP